METDVISKQTANYPLTWFINYWPATSFTAPTKKIVHYFKSGAGYVLSAVGKVLKLNILGADINTDYLQLTVGVYAGVFMLYVKEYVSKLTLKTLADKIFSPTSLANRPALTL